MARITFSVVWTFRRTFRAEDHKEVSIAGSCDIFVT